MADANRPLELDDYYRMTRAEDPRISPDGAWIAFVRMHRDRVKNRTVRAIWRVRPDGTDLHQLTRGPKSDTHPRWSPDGRYLAFVSARGGENGEDRPQVYIMRADGGEAEPLTSLPNGASDPMWSPDSRFIACLSRMRPDEMAREDHDDAPEPPADTFELEQRRARRKHEEEQRHDPRVVERMPFRTGTQFWDERFSQVYVVPVEPDENDERAPRRLTSAARDHGPPAWSADGRQLYSTTSRRPEHVMPWLYSQLIRIDTDDGTVRTLTGEGVRAYMPKPSPDGRHLAFLQAPESLPFTQLHHVMVAPLDEDGDLADEPRSLNGPLDRTVSLYRWTTDGAAVLMAVEDAGTVLPHRAPLEGGAPERLADGRRIVNGLHDGPDDSVVFTAYDTDGSCDLYLRADGEERRLTDLNRALIEERSLPDFEEVRFAAPDGHEIQGWVLKPPDFDPERRYPLALNIHGGPQSMWGPATPAVWFEWQHHAASGYVVFFCNPRGSTGYGEAFTLANQANWGDGPAADVLAGVDEMVARGLADPERLAITGGSYGGYLTVWIIGHDDRFAAAVSQRGVYHLHSFHGTSDIPLLVPSAFAVEPWEDPAAVWAHSPLAYADQIETPLLVIHAEQDYRVPIAEAEQLFVTLKRLGKTVQLVRYPREGHELSRSGEPKHAVDRLARIVGWWDRYCQPERAEED